MDIAVATPAAGILTVEPVLTEAECRELIAYGEQHGFEAAPVNTPGETRRVDAVRNNDRVIFEDARWSELLWQRLRPHLAPDDGAWPVSINPQMKLYRYDAGQFFARHVDGRVRFDGLFSRRTVLVFLNDDYGGGETTFIDLGVAIRGRIGQALLFEHQLPHEGKPILSGRKYLFRSDVMYLRPKPWEAPPA